MKNKKVIVIYGFQRGGTNIVYNIFQSHPLVCSPNDLETGEIISQNYRIRSHNKIGYLIKRIRLWFYDLLNSNYILNSLIVNIVGIIIDRIFYIYKLRNFTSIYNRYKYKNIPYSLEEVKSSILCLKSVKNDIKLTHFLSQIYQNIFFVGLVRNGYAICEGWIRRGKSAKVSGFRYRKYCEMMINDSKRIKNYKIVKFEDILKDPFQVASELYKFAKLKPTSLDKLRLKSKKIMMKNGKHNVAFGKLDAKYWFDNTSIVNLINPNINEIQIQNLSYSDKIIFEREAKQILEYFQYTD